MIYRTEDPFFQVLSQSLEGERAQLRGSKVTVELSAEEVVLIEWALEDYEKARIIAALNEAASEVESRSVDDISRKSLRERIESAFDSRNECQRTMELLKSRLSDALTAAAERKRNQPGFDFN